MDASSMQDPLSMDLCQQWDSISPQIADLPQPRPTTPEFLVEVLSQLLHDPRYTLLIASKFRPILFLLCARWLDQNGDEAAKLAALALLIHAHEELFPILSVFIRKSDFAQDLLSHTSSMSISQLYVRLLAYYRILFACPHAPGLFQWTSTSLSQLLSISGLDNGIKLLIVQCYAIQTRMSEAQRDGFLENTCGPIGEADVSIESGVSLRGAQEFIDGWLLPLLEVVRVRQLREQIMEQNFPFAPNTRLTLEKLAHHVVDIHGVMMLKEPSPMRPVSRLISTSSVVETLRALALRISLRLPTLLSSPRASGKSIILEHLASLLYPASPNQIVILHLSDTSLEARSLLGSYVSSTTNPGTFDWQEGVVVRAMHHGLWLVLKDVDRASSEVLGTLIPLVESLTMPKYIGSPAFLDIPGRERVQAAESFMVFATRSVVPYSDGTLPVATFLGHNKYSQVNVPAPTQDELVTIINGKFPSLKKPSARALIRAWIDARTMGSTAGVRDIGVHELETWCRRVYNVLPLDSDMEMDVEYGDEASLLELYPRVDLREEMYVHARDIFFGAGTFSESARTHVAVIGRIFAEHLSLDLERAQWILENRSPQLQIERDGDGHTIALRIGRNHLPAARINSEFFDAPRRPFFMHRLARLLAERISSCISLSEPVLLVGETGTGKTTLVSYIASLLNRPLVSLNLSQQTEGSDLLGGFKPVDTRIPAGELQSRFLDLFGRTFSRRKNSKFEEAVRKSVNEAKWKRSVELWRECMRLAVDKINSRDASERHPEKLTEPREEHGSTADTSRKRRKLEHDETRVREMEWREFARDIDVFDIQHVRGQGKFAFGFVEGPLVHALRNGHWVLLDEINLASPETLECISSILQGPTASVVLTEQGSFSPVPRHPDFRLFACMNPATDVGKRDLPPNIRSRFTEIYVPSADTDIESLLPIVEQYIGHCTLGDKSASLDVVEFYMEIKAHAERRELADGANHRPHFSMRTLARALTFASDAVPTFGLRRALWEGCLMAFSMALDKKSYVFVKTLAEKHLLAGVKNVRTMMSQIPSIPGGGQADRFERIGPFWLERGDLEPDPASEYIITPSVQTKLVDLARVVLTRRFPVLIEGPTSSGKTSAIEYLARRTGHRFVRVNNHEHTDIQEYVGSYMSDSNTGKLVFHDGILVRALRNGDWIVLDELNLAPTDVLEALNRLLDDNRELLVAETHEVIKPHPHFMLFATQNPPGLYAGRKVLSRAFRNRFLEIHFDDVPQSELKTILSERCRIPDSYASRIVAVFEELSKRRQAGRVFESKHGFATLRDLFRWAGREASSARELAENGYMLLAERARRSDDKEVVKEVIEAVTKEKIDIDRLYNHCSLADTNIEFPQSSSIIWTSAMKRLFVLVERSLKFNEPVLLVGETGSGKTSVCQVYADAVSKPFTTLNCHQSTETADLIGGQRPLRNRAKSQHDLIQEAKIFLRKFPNLKEVDKIKDADYALAFFRKASKYFAASPDNLMAREIELALRQSYALFQWQDGPLIRAMRSGEIFLLDEISLADDSVLERLNSVLEPGRSIVLAERGGFDVEHATVTAHPGFKLIATMNPGGDYGKKELSPALRNRFTEIWVPSIDVKADIRMIIERSWRHSDLLIYTEHILSFTDWFGSVLGLSSAASLRDLLAWVSFANLMLDSQNYIPSDVIFHHAAHMIFLDGLETAPYTSSWSMAAVNELRSKAEVFLEELVPLKTNRMLVFGASFSSVDNVVRIGPFVAPKGPLENNNAGAFSLQAPTTLDNVRRLIRACQLPKPILLEGSPGVGKTSLVTALGSLTGHRVCRVNLSDQTDITDLFGSDFPVEGGQAGEFAWKDAAFLRAMQDGDWVLLDEMNLAPQAVLEGLNAVLDHRGAVFLPELGRSFTKHPQFRVFAAQNPLYQGGGRKGLPRSFLDRFTKVHIQSLTSEDVLCICQHQFPSLPKDYARLMVLFNFRLQTETMQKRMFGREGGPWEFNLRDIMRWATLVTAESASPSHPSDHLDTLYLQRFRNEDDRLRVTDLFREVSEWSKDAKFSHDTLWTSSTQSYVQFGSSLIKRGDHRSLDFSVELQARLRPLSAASAVVQQGWLLILSGNAGAGKTRLVRYLASKAGCRLLEFAMSSGVDTADILGSFEQVNNASKNAARFEWVDGPLVEAIKNGYWMVLDNANLCSPSVLDRINSLCEMNGFLTLTERGHVNGKLEILSPGPGFRLIFTVDPRNGELSRAMRNRGVEIHLLDGSYADKDQIRLLDASRVPKLSGISTSLEFGVVQFSLARRACSVFESVETGRLTSVRNGTLNHESTSSTVLDILTIYRQRGSKKSIISTYARNFCAISLLAPAVLPVFRRLANQNTGVSDICSLIPIFDQSGYQHILQLRHLIGEALVQTRGLPSSFILAQPFDLLLNPKLLPEVCRNANSVSLQLQLQCLSVAIGLLIKLDLYTHTPRPSETTCSVFHESRLCHQEKRLAALPGVAPIFPLYESTMALAYSTIQLLDSGCAEKQLFMLRMMNDLVDFAEHLRASAHNSTLDFSAARVVSQWFQELLAQDTDLSASDACIHAQTLANEVHLASGHGMQEIWGAFNQSRRKQNTSVADLVHLDELASRLDTKQSSHDAMRREIYDVMCLLDIKLPSGIIAREPTAALYQEVEQRISSTVLISHDNVHQQYPSSLAISELEFLWHALRIQNSDVDCCHLADKNALAESMSQNVHEWGELLVRLASHTFGASLLRLTSVQHYLWSVDFNEVVILSTKLSATHQWLTASCDLNPPEAYNGHQGPGLMLMPVLLYETIAICYQDQTLEMLDTHEKTLRLRGSLLKRECQITHHNRIDKLLSVWMGSLLMLGQCFQETYSTSTWQEISNAASQGNCSALTRLLSSSNNPHISKVISDHLLIVSGELDSPANVESSKVVSLGKAWIELGLCLLILYLPNIPLDPIALHTCTIDFWRNREEKLSALIETHTSAAQDFTGEALDHISERLQSELHEVQSQLRTLTATTTLRDTDMEGLHTLYGEIMPFLSQVVFSAKFNDLVRDLQLHHDGAVSRMLTIQANISGFITRLERGYAHFNDITQPLCAALTSVRFGLHLVAHGTRAHSTNAQLVHQCRSIVDFPTVATLVPMQTIIFNVGATVRDHILALTSCAQDISLGGSQSSDLRRIDDVYQRLLNIWLKGRRSQEQEMEESQSLYRHHKSTDHNARSDIELEEEEFKLLFPTFDDVEDMQEKLKSEAADKQRQDVGPAVYIMSAIEKQSLNNLHLQVTGSIDKLQPEEFNEEYSQLRMSSIWDIVRSWLPQLPHELDFISLPYQINAVAKELSRLTATNIIGQPSYNFYHDPNVPEIRKALSAVRDLQIRLNQIIKDWPEQMVLRHILTRCETVLRLHVTSPVAKVLSALEQLIVQTDDWEAYANKDNTLKLQQSALSDLIISWRRLELTCWSRLLESQHFAFSTSMADWWFRLYELSIRGTLASVTEENAATTYFEQMVLLLEQFVVTSPLGQFASRMLLLKSFATYSQALSGIKTGSEANVLARASRILHGLHALYDQFSVAISQALSDKRIPLEKELLDYVKLASWKDVNVHALKQSAQKTHRQLFKCIRKFREALRESVTPILCIRSSDNLIDMSRAHFARPVFDLVDMTSLFFKDTLITSTVTPSYLQNLSGTFAKFQQLLKTNAEPLIDGLSFESVEDFSSQILEISRTLALETEAAGNNAQLHKTLMMRKRKAWVDLLQESKRAGLSSKLKPGVTQRHNDKVWLLDRLDLTIPKERSVHQITFRSSEYLNKLLLLLPELRTSLASHHNDLTTRELERATNFVESGFALALNALSTFNDDYREYEALHQISRRLTSLMNTKSDITRAYDSSPWLRLSAKLGHAFQEIFEGCVQFNVLEATAPLSSQILSSIASEQCEIQHLYETLLGFHRTVTSTRIGFMTKEERNIFEVSCRRLADVKAVLRKWNDEEPRVQYLCDPVLKWLEQSIPPMDISADKPSENSHVLGDPRKETIEQFLLVAQRLLALCDTFFKQRTSKLQDGYISDNETLNAEISRMLAPKAMRLTIESFFESLARQSISDRQAEIPAISHFLNTYMQLMDSFLFVQAQFTKSMFKLTFVLCRVVLSLSQKGFCKPPDVDKVSTNDEGADGTQDGTGLGAGAGDKNVSNEIEDESQVEGLRNEEDPQEQSEAAADGDGIEMDDNFGGKLKDIDEDENENAEGSSDGEDEPDEAVENLDAADPSAIDEKFWGDEDIQGEEAKDQISKDASTKDNSTSDMAAKEDDGHQKTKQDAQSTHEETISQDGSADSADVQGPEDDHAIDAGKQMDDFVPEADTLDLPDDLNMDQPDSDAQEENVDMLETSIDQIEQEMNISQPPEDQGQIKDDTDTQASPDPEETQETLVDDPTESTVPEQHDLDPPQIAATQPDLSASGGGMDTSDRAAPEHRSDTLTEEIMGDIRDDQSGEANDNKESCPDSTLVSTEQNGPKDKTAENTGFNPSGTQESFPLSNPLRSLGDTLKEIHRRWEQIGDAHDADHPPVSDVAMASQELEYLQQGMVDDNDMQALGPATEDQMTKIRDAMISDEEEPTKAIETMEAEIVEMDADQKLDGLLLNLMEARVEILTHDPTLDQALNSEQINRERIDRPQQSEVQANINAAAIDHHIIALGEESSYEDAVKLAVKQWQESGHSDSLAGEMWRLYVGLTRELSFTLCEQLRLILEPTLATRLRGDYRTGKRLNMKKIIPYIASEYTKDKIWLRRTRPSQREYQVLIALDDSRSMAESRSVHLAYETLALVSKALDRLEAGEVAIARFGEGVELVHSFEDGMVGDREGDKIMKQFKFQQRRTDVLGLVEASLQMLMQARERKATGQPNTSASELWQLELIISDGICQDHDKLRTVLRRAEEQRIMIVFVVIDSLHSHHDPTKSSFASASQNSILSMNQVSYKDIGSGRLELQLDRYLDTFPFQYYVVLRAAEALPDVLAGTLKQFFERISEE